MGCTEGKTRPDEKNKNPLETKNTETQRPAPKMTREKLQALLDQGQIDPPRMIIIPRIQSLQTQ